MANVEITATYVGERLRFHNPDGDVVVANIRHLDGPKPEDVNGKPISAKGPADVDQLKQGLTYKFYGRWTEYRGEPQFVFQTVVPAKPMGREGITTYLAHHGDGLGIGPGRAVLLFEAFGTDAVRVCREQPGEAVTAVPRWRLEQAEAFAARLQRAAHTEECSIQLVELLNGRGFPKATAQRAMQKWGNAAPEVIRTNPYRLMEFRGCGFKRTDAMYLDLRLPAGKLKRQALCAWHAIASDSSGNTWFPVEMAMRGIRRNVGGCELREAQALKLAKRASILSFQCTDKNDGLLVDAGGKLWCAETKNADHENFIARCIAAADEEIREWPDVASVHGITVHQRERLSLATGGLIGILGGGPGTGKTYTAATLIIAIRNAGIGSIAVAAPTGKAAVRITEALANYGIPLRATTIHSLLKIAADGGFEYRQGRPLPQRFIVIDESSMIDTNLMASLLAARGSGTHILFVGDINQLPPVGHGAPLRDFIAAGLPYGELEEIHRQAAGSMIVQACHAIRNGRPYRTLSSLDEYDGGDANLIRLEAAKPEEQIAEMLRSIRWASEKGFDPTWDVQVLAAVNSKSPLARKPLNKLLQGELNSQPPITGSPFRLGDKIVNTKNSDYTIVSRGDGRPLEQEIDEETGQPKPNRIRVANGDLAAVIEVADKYLLARLVVTEDVIRIPRGRAADDESDDKPADGDPSDDDKGPNTGCSWDLAYALSTHKSQGSEWPVVIVLLDEYPGAMRIGSREWIYTADSRGKQLQIEIGKEGTARRMVRRVALNDRKTLLCEQINYQQCKRLVESI